MNQDHVLLLFSVARNRCCLCRPHHAFFFNGTKKNLIYFQNWNKLALPSSQLSISVNFHLHFTCSFCADTLLLKSYKSQTGSRENLRKTLLYKKITCKPFLKLTPSVQFHWHFTSSFFAEVLCTAFFYLQFFWPKSIGAKAARKIKVILIQGSILYNF